MSDVFNLPVTTDIEVCTLEDISPIAIAASLLNKEYVFHAINSHDQLLRTIEEKDKVISELSSILDRLNALGFLTESHDSGVFHRELCRDYRKIKVE